MIRSTRRDAVSTLRRAQAEREDRALRPLVPVATACRLGIATRLGRPAVVASVAILVLGAMPAALLLMLGATSLSLLAWRLTARKPESRGDARPVLRRYRSL